MNENDIGALPDKLLPSSSESSGTAMNLVTSENVTLVTSAKKRSFSENDIPVALKRPKLSTDSDVCSTELTQNNSNKRKSAETDVEISHKKSKPIVNDADNGTVTSATAAHSDLVPQTSNNEREQLAERESPDIEIVLEQVELINIDDDDDGLGAAIFAAGDTNVPTENKNTKKTKKTKKNHKTHKTCSKEPRGTCG